MANERLYQFPSKASPVPADIIFAGDSANSFDEVQITIAELIAAYPNLSGLAGLTLGANTYPYVNNSSAWAAGSISALAVTLLANTTTVQMQGTIGYTATVTASQFAGWDANLNLSANNFLAGYATTATAAGTTTLTVGSAYQQFFTGSTTQTVLLPVTSTLVLGQGFYIVNNSSGNVTVQSSGGNTIQVMAAGTTLAVTCILTSGTTAASWAKDYNLQIALSLPLSVANGGSGVGTLTGLITGNGTSNFTATAITQYNVLTGGASNAPNSVAPSGTSGVPLISQGSSAQPIFGTAVVAGGGTGLTAITAHNLMIGNATSAPNLLAPSSTVGVPLISQGASADPVYGTAAIAGGGTGVTSVTTAPTASAWAGWDANSNFSANNLIEGYATTATAAGTTTLTVASAYNQFFTGSTTQTVKLPVTSTLVLGQQYYIVNNSSGTVTVQSSGSNTIQAMAPNTTLVVTCILTSGTTAASWAADYNSTAGGSGTVTSVSGAGLATGTVTTSGSITVTAAVKSDQTTGSSTSVAVVPGVQQYHASAAKVWCNKAGSSTTINGSYNVSSTTHAATGTHVINFTTSMTDTNYVTVANSLIAATLQWCIPQSQATGSVSVNTYNSGGTLTDPTQLLVACFGTQ